MGGGGARWRNCPQNRWCFAELPSSTTWQRSLETRGGANGPPSVRQVWCWVREPHLPAYSSINGFFKKPFIQVRGGKASSTLLQCQSLPATSLRAVRSEYPAYIVARLYISRGRGLFGLSRHRFILPTINISAEDSEHQVQSLSQQHMWNSNLFVVFLLKSTAAHSLHIQHL
jgi:hypothetical protein